MAHTSTPSWHNRNKLGIALALGVLLHSNPSSASVFSEDDRVTAAGDASDLEAVGVIRETAEGSYGTAFLVAPCYALSAKHIVHHADPIGRNVTLRFKLWQRSDGTNTTNAAVVAAGGRAQAAGDLSQDWLLLRLDRCLGDHLGYFRLSREALQIRGAGPITPKLIAVGYPADRLPALRPTIDPACRVRLITSYGLLHDCATLPGNSGGPLMAWNAQHRRYEVVAINVAGHDRRVPEAFDLDSANAAVSVEPIVAILDRRAAESIDRVWRPSEVDPAGDPAIARGTPGADR